MNYRSRLNHFHGSRKLGKQRTIVLDPILAHVNNYDPKGQIPQIVLELKAAVDGHEHVELTLGVFYEIAIRQRAPRGFGDGNHFIVGKRLPDARVDALV